LASFLSELGLTLLDYFFRNLDDFIARKSLCERCRKRLFELLCEPLPGHLGFVLVCQGGDEKSLSPAGVDQALALEAFIGPLDRDDADTLFAGQAPDRGQVGTRGKLAGQNLGPDLSDDLTLERLVGKIGQALQPERLE